MDVFYAYTYGTAGWMTLQALPLLISPSSVVLSLTSEARQVTDVETYLGRSLGLALLIIGFLPLPLTNSIPLTSSPSTSSETANENSNPYVQPTLFFTLLHHSLVAFYTYTRYNTTSLNGFIFHSVISGAFAAVGLWCVLFSQDGGHIGKRSGQDKRMSGFPFGGKSAEKRKKKAME
ncbi:hypothetical protein K402DRAFT_358770 [Aulographum hederae CBS 113979]|uniref:Uncharacterized protein n=1 Tax=Aulographum hederae CBS 113979 TaxID=1176131 RepID=A0A6G1GVJ1_9PEZI|nr:hypothetical protein K402DRAFT_358770 [Aulographum hederae CBS 113979]